MIHPELTRYDTKDIPENMDEIRLFGVCCNEILRLPYLLTHYRNLGVNRFFFISNASTDGTDAFLQAQPDCHLFHTNASYAQARAGLSWLNSLLHVYGTGQWIVLSDSDELLIYPNYETKKLPELCTYLTSKGYEGMFTVLLDMYSDVPLAKVNYKQGNNFLECCPYFDRDYLFVRRLGIPLIRPAFPPYEVIGGPRYRLCFKKQYTPNVMPRLWPKLTRRILKTIHRFHLLEDKVGETPAPQAFKIPLVKWQKNYAYITSHRLNPIRLAPTTGALLHFKYLQDFSARVDDAIRRGSHYDGSAEYKKYAEILEKSPDFNMTYLGSTKFKNSQDLLQYHIMQQDNDWKTMP